MAIDLRNDQGELDRSKVIKEIKHRTQPMLTYEARVDRLIELMDEVHEAAWQDGYRKSVEDNT